MEQQPPTDQNPQDQSDQADVQSELPKTIDGRIDRNWIEADWREMYGDPDEKI